MSYTSFPTCPACRGIGCSAHAGTLKVEAAADLRLLVSRRGVPPLGPPVEPVPPSTGWTLIADSRLQELRAVNAAGLDFQKLIRLCEELNTVYSQGCYFATIMLTRSLLDHVPTAFGKATFTEVVNNYSGGKSFGETMHRLEGAARKIADAHLHMAMRASETLPTAQQVNFGPQLDVLLAEIVRIAH
jgi:hypothetical protein